MNSKKTLKHALFILSFNLGLVALLSACSTRGYKELPQDVPELFYGLDKNLYNRYETPKNIIYQTKKIEEKVDEFYKEDYTEHIHKKYRYTFYRPKDRQPAKESNFFNLFSDLPIIENKFSTQERSLLIEAN